MSQLLFPDPPLTPGQTYNAPNGVTYTWDDTIGTGVWKAGATAPTPALTITNPGTITGTAQVGATLSYAGYAATGGTGTISYSWTWKYTPNVTISGPGTTGFITVPPGASGQSIFIELTATDSATPTPGTATATTANFPASGTITKAPFPSGVWSPIPGNGLDLIPGGQSGTYNGTGTTITTTGCIEAAVATPPTVPSSYSTGTQSISSGQTLATRWSISPTCGGAPSGTPLTGTITDGTYEKTYNISINRVPSPTINDITDTNVALGATVSKGITPAIAGLNTTAYVTAGAGSTGLSIGVSLTAGGPFTPIPAAGSTSFPITNGQTLYVQQTVGGTVNTAPGYTAVVKVGDADGVLADEFTYFAQTVSSAVFPGLTFTPAGGPNAANETVLNVTGGGSLGTLNGVANSNSWPTGLGTTLSSPVSGANPTMKFRVNGGGGYVTSGLGVVPTDILNLAWNEAYLATVADGGTANGSITGTVGAATYTNTFTMNVKRDTVWSIGTPVTNVALNSSQSTSLLLPNDYNVPVTVTFNNPTLGTSPLPMIAGTISYAIDSNPAVSVTLGTTTATLNPGETLQVFGDVGGTNNQTYGIKIKIGTSAAQDWLVTTTAVTPSVKTPIIGPPSNNATGVGTPSGLTINADTYTPLNGAGTHASSNWELYSGSYPLTSTSNITTTATTNPTWTTQTSGFGTSTILGIVRSATQFVAVGANGKIGTSPDGINWTQQTSGTANPLRSIAYNGSLFVAIGASGTILTSANGTAWTPRANPGFSGGIDVVFYANGIWMASGQLGQTATSIDGITWSMVGTVPTGQDGISLAFNGGTWVVGAAGGILATSTNNGASWIQRTLTGIGGGLITEVVYANGTFVAVTNGGLIYTSPTGVTWNQETSVFGGSQIQALIYQNGLFIAAGASGKLATSPDGVTWTLQSTGLTFDIYGLSYGNGRYVAAGFNGSLATSTLVEAGTTLTITGCSTDGFQVGDTIVSLPSGAGPATITAVDNSNVTVVPSSALWTTQKITRATSMYTQIVPPPSNPNSSNLESITVAAPPLLANTTYYVRVQYTSNLAYTSSWSDWSKFTTGALVPAGNATVLATNPSVTGVQGGSQIHYDGSTYAFGAITSSTANQVFYSTNLTSWNNNSIGSSSTSNGPLVAWTGSGGRWVAASWRQSAPFQNAFYASTPSGAWSAGGGTWADGNPLTTLIVKDTTSVFTANGNYWGISSDGGQNYTVYSSPIISGAQTAFGFGSGTYFNGAYIVAGGNNSSSAGVISRSTTGASGSWTFPVTNASGYLRGSASSPTAVVAIPSANGPIYRSADGIAWNTTSAVPTEILRSVAYGDGIFIAVGDNGNVWISGDDGLTWTNKTTTANLPGVSLRGINYVNGKWLAVSSAGTVYEIT